MIARSYESPEPALRIREEQDFRVYEESIYAAASYDVDVEQLVIKEQPSLLLLLKQLVQVQVWPLVGWLGFYVVATEIQFSVLPEIATHGQHVYTSFVGLVGIGYIAAGLTAAGPLIAVVWGVTLAFWRPFTTSWPIALVGGFVLGALQLPWIILIEQSSRRLGNQDIKRRARGYFRQKILRRVVETCLAPDRAIESPLYVRIHKWAALFIIAITSGFTVCLYLPVYTSIPGPPVALLTPIYLCCSIFCTTQFGLQHSGEFICLACIYGGFLCRDPAFTEPAEGVPLLVLGGVGFLTLRSMRTLDLATHLGNIEYEFTSQEWEVTPSFKD